jgi:hypothetical protein
MKYGTKFQKLEDSDQWQKAWSACYVPRGGCKFGTPSERA